MIFQLLQENQASRERGRNRTVTPTLGVPGEPLSDENHGGPNQRPDHIKLGKGPDQQGFHSKDLDEQMQDPQDEPLQGELLNEPIPESMKVLKTATIRPAEQKVTYLQTTHRNVVNYANLKPRMTSLMQFIMVIWYLFTNLRTFIQKKVSM
ncbi:UNVERIFIED_CONTAM: hypothetical protein Slati_2932500 [Sesamum latifolium]|uniref:Uncharacterized protein n=1 Tax=Sesamum latifolium TaxID=2727402 RepID=A0AAW2VHC2_9LAMI